jgi:hypothetical protein
LADLAVDFGSFAIVFQEIVIHVVDGSQMANFLSSGALKIVILDGIFDDLAFWEWLVVEEVGQCDSGRSSLLSRSSLLFLLLVILSLLLLALSRLVLKSNQVEFAYQSWISSQLQRCHRHHLRLHLRLRVRLE